MKAKKEKIMKKRITLKRLCALMASALLLLCAMPSQAQNVTISPQNGSMICALTAGSPNTQYGFQVGAFATWRHNQLSLTMTASNDKDLTEDGQLKNHANHFMSGDKCTYNPALTSNDNPSTWIDCGWGGSQTREGYFTIALPKGYRFTGYKFDLTHDISSVGQGNAFTITTNTNVSISETGSDFGTAIKTATLPGQSNTVVTFTRTGNDMGNILYFKTTAPQNGFFDLTFRYVELTFTADADSPIGILPSSQVSDGHSLIVVPFNTGKVDLGEIKQGSYNGATRVSYQYNTVTDMPANMLLYEYESTKAGTALDGTEGFVAYDKTGSISTSGEYFKFAPSSDKAEQKYVLETPVSATQAGNVENPVQFRITEATINYTTQGSGAFHIIATIDGTKYYLTNTGRFSTDVQTAWNIDESGHIYSGSDYIQATNGDVQIVNSANNATVYSIDNNTIRYKRNNGSYRYLKAYPNYTWDYDAWDYVVSYYSGRITDSNDYTTASVEEITGDGSEGATIYIYDKEGKTKETIEVSGSDSRTLYDLNNDAIIFGVKGGDEALINFSLKIQALNPYIDQMTVVLNDQWEGKDIRMTRTFTADDFSVGGGTFRFYLPTDCVDDHLTITFEDLYSKYGDDTYDHTKNSGASSSRYNFVMSQHHQNFTNDNIYSDRDEAASGTLESARIEAKENIRTQVGTVGNIAFRFNNADELATNTGYLTEYPFTIANYQAQTGEVVEDGETTTATGDFITAEFEPSKVQVALHDKTFYVFTTDETRYNIAPTTATQHRFYAFYAMKVEVICQDYSPIVSFEKVYDTTFNENGTGAFYGVKVSAPAGIDAPLASDVATFKAISEAIEAGGDNVPTDLTQILYLDMSGLNGVYHSKPIKEEDNKYTLASFDELKDKFAHNALVFLPANSTATFDNFAYAKKGEMAGSFQSANNIILTDKQPFYSPYTIQVDAANYATYSRTIPAPPAGEEKNVTLMLPYTISLAENGIHTNADGLPGAGLSFSVNTMDAQNDMSLVNGSNVNYGNAYFKPITSSATEANKPYMIKIENDAIEETADGLLFTVSQKGSSIIKTPTADAVPTANDKPFCTGAIIKGEQTSGKFGSDTYQFTNYASYSGNIFDRAVSENVFYFGNTNNKYVDLHTLARSAGQYLYVYPFRGVYTYEGNRFNAKSMRWFNICYDENPLPQSETTAIQAMPDWADLMIRTDKGSISLTAKKDQTVDILSVSGVMMERVQMASGDTKVVSLPAGVYVVNGTKIVVK